MNNIIGLQSKHPDKTLLPQYYEKAKDVYVWIDDKKYLDMSFFGIGSCMLGYANKEVNQAVKDCIDKGNMASLTPIEEKILADKLIEIHPWCQKVRYARTGGESIKIALELVMKYAGHIYDDIVTIGYNGWYLKDKYKNLQKIDDILYYKDRPEIIIFELARQDYPNPNAIDKLKAWQKKGTILICDEITTGFRLRYGGYHQEIRLEPDIIVYGKAISNGYPMSVIIGKEEIINQDIFISSTYWTEKIGTVAALKTMELLAKEDYYRFSDYGYQFKQILRYHGRINNINIKFNKINYMIYYEFDNQEIRKKFTDEMFKRGILANGIFYPSFVHKREHLEEFQKACSEVFKCLQ